MILYGEPVKSEHLFFSGECLVYGFDDITGALQISYKLVLSSKDYPGIL